MNRRRIRFSLTAIFLVLGAEAFCAGQARAGVFYVSPSGNDSNTGTLSSPFATPRQAESAASSGDTIYLRGGTYTFSRTLVIDKNGITFSAYPTESPTFSGSTTDTTNLLNMVYVTGSNVSLIGIEIEGGSYYGLKIESNSGTTVRNCHIHDNGMNNCKMYLADNMLFEGCDMGPNGVRDNSDAQCINAVACNYAEVRNCHFHDSAQNGVYFKGGSVGCVVEANLLERCGYAGILLGQDTDLEFMRDGTQYEAINCIARNNIVVGAGGAGIGTFSSQNCRVENNTLYNVANTYNAGLYIAWNSRNVQATQVTFKNNIVVVMSSRPMFYSIGLSDQLMSDYNLYFRPNGGNYGFWEEQASSANYWNNITAWQSGMSADLHSATADPRLDSSHQYIPLSGSPAIDHGTTIAEVPTDYAGTTRPQGSAYDIGAWEVPQQPSHQPPQVTVSATPSSGVAPLSVSFSASVTDQGASVTGYQWDFGDGQTSAAASPGHVYSGSGAFTAKLTVTDSDGATGSAQTTVTVTAPPDELPQVSINASPTSGQAPLTVGFQAQASDPDGSITRYSWDFGDGQSSTASSPSHIYLNPGNYTARLTVTDSASQTAAASVNVAVSQANTPPQVSISATPSSGPAPLPVAFTAHATDSEAQLVSYTWTFGDGGSSTLVSPTHTYSTQGTYTARLTIIDGLGASASASVTIQVSGNAVQRSQNVQWVNLVGVSASGNSITKTAVSTWGNAGATSSESIQSGNGYVEFTAEETSTERMCGLSSKSSNQAWGDIAFAVHLNTGAAFYVNEAGTERGYFGDYRPGDIFRVAIESGVVKYSRNGTLFYTSTLTPAYPLRAGAVLDGQGATIDKAVISSPTTLSANVNVAAPTNSQTLKFGADQSITWSIGPAAGQDQISPQAAGGNLSIALSVDGGQNWTTIATGLDASATTFNWVVPAIKTKQALIQVTLTGTDGSTTTGTSGMFSISRKGKTLK